MDAKASTRMSGTGKKSLKSSEQTSECTRQIPEIHLAFVDRKGEPRASIRLRALEALWFNTGTLCNVTCTNCYIQSSPRNDRLVYLSLADVETYLMKSRAAV